MCGIAGIASSTVTPDSGAHRAVQRMTARMSQRGPDAEGQWTGEGVVLGHRRLAILDLDTRANQPMVSDDSRFAIVFNGEIYNFSELRQELGAGGTSFRTTSDTEVLLALFRRDGERMLPRLRGMFALAIWDTQSRELFLARDPYGIKPLYYTQHREGLFFASQVKALLASGEVASDREPAGLAGFCLWGSVPEPWTMFRGVFALPAGHSMRVRGGIADAPVSWHDIRIHWRSEGTPLSAHKSLEKVRASVRDSVRAHLVSDVPVSVFLSGGVDSGVIAGLISELGARVEGITISFAEFRGSHRDEAPVASAIAAHYGLDHHVRQVTREEFEQDVPRILDAMDQPSIDGVNTWFASKAAAERGYKVVLSGIGGDELFCGYSSFGRIPRQAALGRLLASIPGARSLLRLPCAGLARGLSRPKVAGLPDFMGSLEGLYFLNRGLFLPGELPQLLGVEVAREGLARLGGFPFGMTQPQARDGVAAVGSLESTNYLRNQLLRDSDWASMSHSVELRTPLVDVTLLESLAPLVSGFGGGAGKRMLARSPERGLPDLVVNRPKTGFSLPMAAWMSAMTQPLESTNQSAFGAKGPWARRWGRALIDGITKCG